MLRFIVFIIIALAAFWCYNNLNFSEISNKVVTSVQNEKTIKAVRYERQTNYANEQSVINNEY